MLGDSALKSSDPASSQTIYMSIYPHPIHELPVHYSRRTTVSKFHTPRRDEFSSRLVLLSFLLLLLLLYKRGRKMIDRSQQMEVGISQNEARDKKRTHLNLWTAERNDTPPVPNVFQLHQLFFTLIRMSIRFSLFFFWISSRLLLYTDLNVLWPLWPLLPTIFFCEIHTIRRIKSLWPINNCLPVQSTYGVTKKSKGLL